MTLADAVDAEYDRLIAETRDGVRARASGAGRFSAIAVVRDVDLGSFARGAVDFTWRMPDAARRHWYWDYTRTVFLAGDPAKVSRRLRLDHVAPGGEVGWRDPAPAARHSGVRRLLRGFDGRAPAAGLVEDATVAPGSPGPGHERWLHLAVARVSIGEYLVHLNHTLSEATIRGVLAPGDTVRVTHVPEIGDWRGDFQYVRVRLDDATGVLRTYACLGGPRLDA